MRYRFGQCELVPETRELLVAGAAEPVEPQVFDLIHFLVRERARVITTDELIAAIWGGRIVSDSAIAARISAARAAISDDGERQTWIKTIRGRGFRFVGAVDEGPQPKAATDRAEPDQLARQRIAFCRSRDGTRIAYAVSGSGYPVLKVGHWLTHLEHYTRSPVWRPFYDRLNQSFLLVRYDQRGNGLSDWDVADFSFDRFVEDIEAVVEAAGLERFALLGMSQGAPIAIAYAARYPERVSHLVLYGGYEKGRLLRGSASEREQGEAILTLIRHGWGKPGSPFINAFTSMFIPDGTKEQIDALVDLQRLTTSPENAALLRAAVDRFDASAEVGKVAVPALVLHSRDDGVQPLEQGRQLAANIPGAEFVMLESRDHIILSQEPAWPVLFGEIERFIGGGDAKR